MRTPILPSKIASLLTVYNMLRISDWSQWTCVFGKRYSIWNYQKILITSIILTLEYYNISCWYIDPFTSRVLVFSFCFPFFLWQVSETMFTFAESGAISHTNTMALVLDSTSGWNSSFTTETSLEREYRLEIHREHRRKKRTARKRGAETIV